MIMIAFLIACLIMWIVWRFVDILTNWSIEDTEHKVHIDMVKSNCKEYGYGTYDKFVENFKKYELTEMDYFRGSFENYHNDSKFHASIIKFNGKGMILGRKDLKRAQEYCKKIADNGKNTVEW